MPDYLSVVWDAFCADGANDGKCPVLALILRLHAFHGQVLLSVSQIMLCSVPVLVSEPSVGPVVDPLFTPACDLCVGEDRLAPLLGPDELLKDNHFSMNVFPPRPIGLRVAKAVLSHTLHK